MAGVIGADLFVASDADASPYELAVVETQTLASFAAFDAAFGAAAANAKTTPPTTRWTGRRIDVTDAVQAIAVANPAATTLDVLGRSVASGSATVSVRLALRYAAAEPARSIVNVGVREVTAPLTTYCIDADAADWWHTIRTGSNGKPSMYPAVTITPSFNPAAISSSDLDAWFGYTGEDGTYNEPWEFVSRSNDHRFGHLRRSAGVLAFVSLQISKRVPAIAALPRHPQGIQRRLRDQLQRPRKMESRAVAKGNCV